MTPKQLAIGLLLALPSAANAGEWNWSFTPYIWLPGADVTIDTLNFGTVEVPGGGDTLSASLDGAFMGVLEARNGKWGLIGDLQMVSVSNTDSTPASVLYSSVTVDVEADMLTLIAAYRFKETPTLALDVTGGFRSVSLGMDATFGQAALPSVQESTSTSWVDPVIGGRAIFYLSDRWSAVTAFDLGGTGSSATWQIFGTVDYNMGKNWSLEAGYRFMSLQKEVEGRNVNLDLYGPMVGLTFKF